MFQIIIPAFNEQTVLEKVLGHAKQFDYISHVVVVNDASTDSTKEILDRWVVSDNLRVVHLQQNARKEGAIRIAMESLQFNGNLAPYTVLLDADTRLQESRTGESVLRQISGAIDYMNHERLGAMALRVNASYFHKPTAPFLSAYAIYFALQFDSWLFGLQRQLWVINGAGGLFNSSELFQILQGMGPSFETGDLQITVDLMKQGHALRLYNSIEATTYVPESFVELFNQRRRWERGTLKVMWAERKFYLSLFRKPTFLTVAVVLHLALYVGIFMTVLAPLRRGNVGLEILEVIALSFLFWFTLDLLKGAWVATRYCPRRFPLFLAAAIVNGPVWLFVVIPARLCGGVEAIIYLVRQHRHANENTTRSPR